VRAWIPTSKFQDQLKSKFETKAELMDLLEISRPTLDSFMREERRFLPYLPILARRMKTKPEKLFNLLDNRL